MTALYEGFPKVSPTVGTFAPLHWLTPKPCETCSEMKCPKTENLLVKLWSMRTTSSFKFVGELLPPMNVGLPFACVALAAGKIPAVSKAVEFGSIMQEGIVLFGNGEPCTTPAGKAPPGQFFASTPAE